MLAKLRPQAARAGQTASVSRVFERTRTSQNGIASTASGRMRPSIALKSASGRPVTATSVRTGLPKPPKATGAEFPIRQMRAVCMGGNPSPIIMAPHTATGAPPPPAPSSSEPKANAISSTCNRRSQEMPLMDFLMISNCPDSTEMS